MTDDFKGRVDVDKLYQDAEDVTAPDAPSLLPTFAAIRL